MNQKNEIILKVEVISEPKEVALFKLESNLNKETFFLCDEKMGEKNFINAGDPNEVEMASYNELNSENCEMYLDNQKIPFEKYHIFTKEGIYTIKYILSKKITNCKKMFLKCDHIISIDLSNFDSSEVIDMSLMFINCFSLEEINFGNFKTSKVINMEGMFECCASLKYLNLSSFDTSNVENMNSMFTLCASLKELNVLNFNTEKVKDMNSIFAGVVNLTSLDLSSFSSDNLEIINFMFKNSFNLKTIKFSNKFKPNIKNMYGAFLNCESLEILQCSEDLYDEFVLKETGIYNLEKVKFVSIDGPNPELKEFKSQYHEHILKKEVINDSKSCEGCSLIFNEDEMFTCKECNFSFCSMCVKMEKKKGYIALKGILHQHEMKLQGNLGECKCKSCGEVIPVKKGYFCEICKLAYCKKCTKMIFLSYLLNLAQK